MHSTNIYLCLYPIRHMVKDHFWLASGDLLCAPFHRHDSICHDLCYTSCGTLVRTRNSSMGHQVGVIQTYPHHGGLSTTEKGRKEMFYLMTHSTHLINGYMALDIWQMTILIVKEETCCRHYIGYSFRLGARVLFISTIPKTGVLAGMRNSSISLSRRIDPTTHHTNMWLWHIFSSSCSFLW